MDSVDEGRYSLRSNALASLVWVCFCGLLVLVAFLVVLLVFLMGPVVLVGRLGGALSLVGTSFSLPLRFDAILPVNC